MKNQVKDWDAALAANVLNSTGATVPAGRPILFGGRWGVAHAAIANGATGTAYLAGVFKIPKATGGAIAAGTSLWWDAANSRVTATPNGVKLGEAYEDAATNDTEINVFIVPSANRVYQEAHAVTAGENTANQADFNVGFPVANATVVAQLRNTSGVQRVATITKNPGGSAPNTVRVADANMDVNEIIEILVVA